MKDVPQSRNLIVFDDTCLFCSGFARFIAKRDERARFRFTSATSPTGQSLYLRNKLDPQDFSTNIVVLNGETYFKMAAFTAAMVSLGGVWSWLRVLDLLPRPVADWIYDRIARNRYVFGKSQCPVPSRELKDRLID